jgi:hypothetical protein
MGVGGVAGAQPGRNRAAKRLLNQDVAAGALSALTAETYEQRADRLPQSGGSGKRQSRQASAEVRRFRG